MPVLSRLFKCGLPGPSHGGAGNERRVFRNALNHRERIACRSILATPDEIRAEVRRNLEIFTPGGGYVFNPIHNVQSGVPVENQLAMYETVKDFKF